MTPYYNCGDHDMHMITPRTWIIIFSTISCLQVIKEKAKEKVEGMYSRNELTYKMKSRLLLAMTLSVESIHFFWQVYGNIIYYGSSTDPKVIECNAKKNPGTRWIMLFLLIFGYLFFVIYAVVIALVLAIQIRRFTNRRFQRSQSSRVLKSISRIKFSEELFGALNDDNECIICMAPYQQNEMITKLNCNARHYYHTRCIEDWIKQGSNQCPMCREPIQGDLEMAPAQN